MRCHLAGGVGVHREVRAADPMVRRARPAGFQPGGGGGTSLDLDTAHHLSRLPRSGRRMLPCRRLRPQTRCTPSVSAASTGWSAASLTAFELYSTRPRLRTSLAHRTSARGDLQGEYRHALHTLADGGRRLEISSRLPTQPDVLPWWREEGRAAFTGEPCLIAGVPRWNCPDHPSRCPRTPR
jgi:hypothetical protein